jgi:hypothetical protein
MRVLDTQNDTWRWFGVEDKLHNKVGFAKDGRLLAVVDGKLLSWTMESQMTETLGTEVPATAGIQMVEGWLGADRETLCYSTKDDELYLGNLVHGGFELLPLKAKGLYWVAVSSGGGLVAILRNRSGDVELLWPTTGAVRRVPIDEGVVDISVDPRGRWIGTAADHAQVWAIPTGRAPEALSQEDFLGWMSALTNLRAVKDTQSTIGYVVRGATIPDWGHPPTE